MLSPQDKILASCLLVPIQTKSMLSYDVHFAGRSEKEYKEVQRIVKEIQLTLLKSKMSEAEAEAVIQDPSSHAYKDILAGKFGDILLTKRDAMGWLNALKGDKRKKRKIYNFERHPSRKWELPIKYMIDTTTITNVTEQDIIEKALRGWEKETCIHFKKIRRVRHGQYLYFTQVESEGCSSYVGKAGYEDMMHDIDYLLNSNRQPVHLAKDCFDTAGVVMHEIGHALGLYHEAQRLDRDKHILIIRQNIVFEDLSNFLKPYDPTVIETKGIPYDLGSLMHYSALDFSIDAEDLLFTILPLNLKQVFVMGQRVEIGFYDAKIINMAYCPDLRPVDCAHGGYTDPNNRSQCKCPAGWQGVNCSEVQEGVQGCSPLSGKIVHQESDYGKTFSVFSPNYREPVNWKYELGDECYWLLQAPSSYQISWWIGYDSDNTGTGYFIGLPAESSGCQFWIEIKTLDEIRGIRFCGLLNDTTSDLTKPHLSHSRELLISFRTFTDVYFPMDDLSFRGVHLQYELRHHSPQKTNSPLIVHTKGFWYFWPDVTTGFINSEVKSINYDPPYPTKWSDYYSSDVDSSLGTKSTVGIIVGCVIIFCLKVCCVVTLCMRRKKQISAFQYRILTDSTTSATGVRRNNATTQANSSNPQTTGAATRESAIPLPYYPPYDYSPSSVAPSKTADNSTLVKGIITGTSINARPRPVVIRREETSRLRPGDLVSLGIEISPDGKSRRNVLHTVPRPSPLV